MSAKNHDSEQSGSSSGILIAEQIAVCRRRGGRGGCDEGDFLKNSFASLRGMNKVHARSLKLPSKTFKNKVLHSHNGYIIIFCIAFSLITFFFAKKKVIASSPINQNLKQTNYVFS